MDTETEDEERENLVEPKFNKSELRKKIQENGGQVLSKFPGEKEKIPEHVVVISDRMCRTMTYLLSVAYGLLNRDPFAKIANAHLNRRKSNVEFFKAE